MATAKSKNTKAINEADQEKLTELFVDGLKDIYWAEKHLAKALPKMAKAATSDELKAAFEAHATETEEHASRLEEIFGLIGEKAQAKKCAAMEGLLEESDEIAKSTDKGTMVRDCGLIMAAQKVEHYEIATYGTLATFCKAMGMKEIGALLYQTLENEKATDEALTKVAEGTINSAAASE